MNQTTLVTCLIAEMIVLAACGWAAYRGSRPEEDVLLAVCGVIFGLVTLLAFLVTVFTAMVVK